MVDVYSKMVAGGNISEGFADFLRTPFREIEKNLAIYRSVPALMRETEELKAQLYLYELMEAHNETLVAMRNGVWYKKGKYGWTTTPIEDGDREWREYFERDDIT